MEGLIAAPLPKLLPRSILASPAYPESILYQIRGDHGDAAASGTLGVYMALFIYEDIYSIHKHYIKQYSVDM